MDGIRNNIFSFLRKFFVLNWLVFISFAFYSKKLTKYCLCFGFLLYLAIKLVENRKKLFFTLIPYTPLNSNIYLFLTAGLLSTIFSLNIYHSQEIFIQRYVPYVIFFWMGHEIISRIPIENFSILLSGFFISSLFFSTGAIRDYIFFHPQRLFTVFGKSYMPISSFLLFVIPLSYGVLIFGKNRKIQFLSIITLGLAIPVMIWHGSRGTWMAITAGVLFISFFDFNKSKKYLFIFLVIGSILTFANPYYQKRAISILEPFSRSTLDDRIDLMKSAIDIFRKHPIFGAGPGMFEFLYTPVQGCKPHYVHFHVHNTYLEILAEMGIFGLIAFLFIFSRLYLLAFRNIKYIPTKFKGPLFGIWGIITAHLVISFSGSKI